MVKLTKIQKGMLQNIIDAGGEISFAPSCSVKTARALEAKGLVTLTSKTTHYTEYTVRLVGRAHI